MAMTASAIMPPMGRDIAHPALVKWHQERREYVDAIEACDAVTGEDKTKVLRCAKNSFNARLLEPLGLNSNKKECITRELNKIVGSVMNDQIVDVVALFNDKLNIDLRERDVKARPAAVRDSIDTHQRIVGSSPEQKLYDLLKEKALEQEKGFSLLTKKKGSSKSIWQLRTRNQNKANKNDRVGMIPRHVFLL
ncbi:Hypothetical protein PHPALM_3147 [Phytophthora palmivora]|uniref:Uncharacterized protein n=1 Tax=Phytophthora palmivora TaxID=4796 RepID=A0A2P4YN52_9STRA|nr:Hypothetical protein PHPALM_3147 [Phytophthora palmivora]